MFRSRIATFALAIFGGFIGNWLYNGVQAQPVPIPRPAGERDHGESESKTVCATALEIVNDSGAVLARLDKDGLRIMDRDDNRNTYASLSTKGLSITQNRSEYATYSTLTEQGLRVIRCRAENNMYVDYDEANVLAGTMTAMRLNQDDRSRLNETRIHATETEIGSRLVFERRRIPGVPQATDAARRGEVTMLRLGNMCDNKEVGLRATRLDRGLTLYHSSGRPYYRVGVVDNLVNNTGYSFAEFLDTNANSRMALGWSNTNKAAIYFYDEKGKPIENLGGK